MGMGPIHIAADRRRQQQEQAAQQRQYDADLGRGRYLTPQPGATPVRGGQGGPARGTTTRLGTSSGGRSYTPNPFSSGAMSFGRGQGPVNPSGPGMMGGPVQMGTPQQQMPMMGRPQQIQQPQQQMPSMGQQQMPMMQNQMARIDALRRGGAM